MLSRSKYLNQLERELEASQQAINELTQENYELKEILRLLQANKNAPERPVGY